MYPDCVVPNLFLTSHRTRDPKVVTECYWVVAATGGGVVAASSTSSRGGGGGFGDAFWGCMSSLVPWRGCIPRSCTCVHSSAIVGGSQGLRC